jgi:hypothetical protein
VRDRATCTRDFVRRGRCRRPSTARGPPEGGPREVIWPRAVRWGCRRCPRALRRTDVFRRET